MKLKHGVQLSQKKYTKKANKLENQIQENCGNLSTSDDSPSSFRIRSLHDFIVDRKD